jgi:hypothetical protein
VAEPPKRKSFRSSLDAHPDQGHAIGMISIESGNLDIMFGHLLSEVLEQPEQIGHAIYLTPRSAMARIEIFRNVAKYDFSPIPAADQMDDEPRKLSEEVKKASKQSETHRSTIGVSRQHLSDRMS